MLIFISRKGRKGRRTSNANYAAAEVVAGYARQRTQRDKVNGKVKTENGKLSNPSALRAITHFLPLRQGRVPHRGGRGWINSLRTLVVTKFATTPAPAWNTKGNKSLRSLRSLREKNNHREKIKYFTQIPRRHGRIRDFGRFVFFGIKQTRLFSSQEN